MARENRQKRHERRFGRAERLADLIADVRLTPTRPLVNHAKRNGQEGHARLVESQASLADEILKAAQVEASNVCEFFFAENAKAVWDVTADFPCCTPPFGAVLIEMTRPSAINEGGCIKPAPAEAFGDRFGWFVRSESADSFRDKITANRLDYDRQMYASMERSLKEVFRIVPQEKLQLLAARTQEDIDRDPTLTAAEKNAVRLARGIAGSVRLMRSSDPFSAIPAAVATLMQADYLMAYRGRVMGPIANVTLMLDRNGKPIERPIFNIFGLDEDSTREEQQNHIDHYTTMLFPLLMSLSFINCKNVALDAIDPPAALNKIRERARLKPFLRYHTINIDPMKTVLRTEGGIEANGLKKALHICRGHFATYSDRMFGRSLAEPVTVWRPAHVRGSIKEGIVLSDYHVNAPAR